jgi:hypothetical protein
VEIGGTRLQWASAETIRCSDQKGSKSSVAGQSAHRFWSCFLILLARTARICRFRRPIRPGSAGPADPRGWQKVHGTAGHACQAPAWLGCWILAS